MIENKSHIRCKISSQSLSRMATKWSSDVQQIVQDTLNKNALQPCENYDCAAACKRGNHDANNDWLATQGKKLFGQLGLDVTKVAKAPVGRKTACILFLHYFHTSGVPDLLHKSICQGLKNATSIFWFIIFSRRFMKWNATILVSPFFKFIFNPHELTKIVFKGSTKFY